MTDEHYMDIALKEARLALEEGEIPVGAVLVLDNKVVAQGHNEREKGKKISAHAEIVVLEKAAQTLNSWQCKDCTLYVTLEPCLMCAGAILQARVKRVVFGARDNKDGAIISRYRVYDVPSLHERPLIDFGIKEKECSDLLSSYFESIRKRQ